jgi:hypothetical protein
MSTILKPRILKIFNTWGGPISPNLPKTTYAITRFLAKILSVPISPNVPISSNLPISPNFFEIYISNYFLSVKRTSFSGLTFTNLVFLTLI